ncbi:MAG: transglutaminase-like domain-containing protein, partial [Anaerolineales bacterium]
MQLVFELYRPSSWIYTFATPRTVEVDTQVSGFRISTTTLDFQTLQAAKRLEKGQRYTILTRYIAPSSDDLRQAEGELPRWVLDHYLQLPANFSPRLRALAEEIVGEAPTRYDKAEAMTHYLREHITYAERIPPPPPGQDVLEWFLFEHRQGFCNYYATAEVLLLRAVGVPARLASGYAQGETQGSGRYIVRERHAHAWPEVYFPGWGWVEFEPTVNQAVLVRPQRVTAPSLTPASTPAIRKPSPHLPKDETLEEATEKKPWPWILLGISGSALLIFLTKRHLPTGNFPLYLQRNLRRYGLKSPAWLEKWARWNMLSPVEKSFEEINRALKHLGVQLPASATPAERAARLGEVLPEVRHAIEELLKEYQTAIYGKGFGHSQRARRAASKIRRAAWEKRYFHFLRE